MADEELELESGQTIPIYLIDEPDENLMRTTEAQGREDELMRRVRAKQALYEPALDKVVDLARDALPEDREALKNWASEFVSNGAHEAWNNWLRIRGEFIADLTPRIASPPRRLLAVLADAAVRYLGTAAINTAEVMPGTWRTTVETDDMIYEIEVRGKRK